MGWVKKDNFKGKKKKKKKKGNFYERSEYLISSGMSEKWNFSEKVNFREKSEKVLKC